MFHPKSTLYQQVPDVTVCHYFLLPSADRTLELHELVRRLQRMDVSVYKLTAPLQLNDFHRYDGTGDAPAQPTTLPKGTYWVPLAQGQKNWIQSMMQDEELDRTDLTYDVTAWSNPLLLNLRGGWSGAEIDPRHSSWRRSVRCPRRRSRPPCRASGCSRSRSRAAGSRRPGSSGGSPTPGGTCRTRTSPPTTSRRAACKASTSS